MCIEYMCLYESSVCILCILWTLWSGLGYIIKFRFSICISGASNMACIATSIHVCGVCAWVCSVQCSMYVRNQFTKYKISLRHTRFKRFKFVFWIEYNELGCFNWRLHYCNKISYSIKSHSTAQHPHMLMLMHILWLVKVNCSQINCLQKIVFALLIRLFTSSPVPYSNHHCRCKKCHFSDIILIFFYVHW